MAANVTKAVRSNYTMNMTFLRYCRADFLRKTNATTVTEVISTAGSSTELINVTNAVKKETGNPGQVQPLGTLLQRAEQTQDRDTFVWAGTRDMLLNKNRRTHQYMLWSAYSCGATGVLFSLSAMWHTANGLFYPSMVMLMASIASWARNLIVWVPTETAVNLLDRINHLKSFCPVCGKPVVEHKNPHQVQQDQ